jgi:hypothetical protein
LQCIFAVLRFGFDSEKLEEGVLPEVEVLERMISYFGPLLLGLPEHINHDRWCIALFQLNRSFTKDNPAQLFSLWATKASRTKQVQDINNWGTTLTAKALSPSGSHEVEELKTKLPYCEEWQRKVAAGIAILRQTRADCLEFLETRKTRKSTRTRRSISGTPLMRIQWTFLISAC